MRKSFHEELKDLKKEVVEVGKQVEKSIALALEAVIEGNAEKANAVFQNDDLIDKKTIEIEEKGISLVATQSPVARDLRLIHSVLFISIHLERMGDLAFNMAKAVKHLTKIPSERENSLVELISKMGEHTRQVVSASIEAFEKNDLKLAEELPKLDEPIDGLFKDFFKALARCSAEEHSLDWATTMVLISRYLERIADHAVDIGERVAYLVTGEFKEFD